MSIVIPTILTPMHKNEIEDLVPVHEQLFQKLAANFNFLGHLYPIGAIIYLEVNTAGVAVPDTGIWQRCDGSKITHPDSPLKSIGHDERFVPNLIDKYLRCAGDENVNGLGGTQHFNFSHSHGGSTGGQDPWGPQEYEGDGDRRIQTGHGHEISGDLSERDIDYPAWVKFVAFMKIT